MRWVDTEVEEIQLLLSQSNAVLVMTGAGISTSAGIPVRLTFSYLDHTDQLLIK